MIELSIPTSIYKTLHPLVWTYVTISSPSFVCPLGANISQSLEMRGDKHFCTKKGGGTIFVESGSGYGDDDFHNETDVSKANIAVSEAGKLSAGARSFKGQNIDQNRLLLFFAF